MEKLADFDFTRLEFFKDGTRKNTGDPVAPPGVTDLIVISHGWHQDPESSKEMYAAIVGHLRDVAKADWNANGRVFGVAGVFWPSDKFRDDLGQETFNVLGGAAASAGGNLNEDVLVSLGKEVGDFLGIDEPDFPDRVALAANGGGDADALVVELRAAVGGMEQVDAQTQSDHNELFSRKGSDIVDDLAMQPAPTLGVAAVLEGNAAAIVETEGGEALGLFSGASAGVAKLLNQFAYFELKKRSAKVGLGLAKVLNEAPGIEKIRVHLIGHSFGARLMTAATTALKTPPKSLSLVQAAFSHNAFGENLHYPPFPKFNGDFRDVITARKVDGPIVITYTWHDHAVGLAYPSASRVSQTIAAGLVEVSNHFGGGEDIYGGLGANGALGLGTDATNIVYGGSSPLTFAPHHVTNVKCDFIESHTDIRRKELAQLFKAAVA
ncbi:hypothetical protein MMA231_02448 [Asticcacaulis sp. MM231]|uniref:hypothetical protein n=1 Tax=Asticcacaulis sp. MM231 TaxID=3157666 RepID=UPI0032D59FB5